MKLIIGLGNPGIKYEKTRHNLGFRVIEELAEKIKFNHWKAALQFHALITQGYFNKEKIILAQPQNFINNSGPTVKTLAKYYRIPDKEILIIHDDIDLPLGEIRIQQNRGAAGHKGVQSIIDYLKSKNFIRIRIGIKPIDSAEKTIDTEKPSARAKLGAGLAPHQNKVFGAEFVLGKFTPQEEAVIKKTIEKAADLITAAL